MEKHVSAVFIVRLFPRFFSRCKQTFTIFPCRRYFFERDTRPISSYYAMVTKILLNQSNCELQEDNKIRYNEFEIIKLRFT